MRRFIVFSAACLLACSSGETGNSNTFSSIEGGENDTSTEANGDGDGAPGDGDGTPGDGDGTPGDGDGTPGDGDGTPGDGDGTPDVCERFVHIYDFGGGGWQSQPLDEVWTGANAPPCDVEPMAATYLELWDQLLVWGANGSFYRRINGTWQPPEPIASRWAMLAGLTIDSVNYVPPTNGGSTCGLIFTALPTAYLYDVYQDGATAFDQTVPLMDEPPPGPAQSSTTREWSLELADPALIGQADWWVNWSGWSDGNVRRFNGAFEWMGWPGAQSPMFSGAPPNVNFSSMEAAWGNYALNRAYLVGP